MGKWQKHKKTSHAREPTGQAFPACKEQTDRQTQIANNVHERSIAFERPVRFKVPLRFHIKSIILKIEVGGV